MDVKIGVSNRHIHLNNEDYKTLFGDIILEKEKDLVQTGEFASKFKVIIKTDKAQINNVRVLGPLRNYTQVEISKTDSYTLGIKPPIRTSGDLRDAETIRIIGPIGSITKNCCIIPNRHIHIDHNTREQLNLLNRDTVSVRLGNEKKAMLEDVYIKETPQGVLELHIDTDDANGNFVKTGDEADII